MKVLLSLREHALEGWWVYASLRVGGADHPPIPLRGPFQKERNAEAWAKLQSLGKAEVLLAPWVEKETTE